MLKYVSKFAMDILPSVAATIIGAYIVNHYIVTKPGTVAPVAAVVSTTEPKAGVMGPRRFSRLGQDDDAGATARGTSRRASRLNT